MDGVAKEKSGCSGRTNKGQETSLEGEEQLAAPSAQSWQ